MIERVLRVSAALACAVALLSAMPAAAADDAAALLAKHQAYVGWHIGDGVVKTLRASGTITDGGKTVGTIALLRYGIAQKRMNTNSQGRTREDGFTGSIFWTTGTNGFTLRPVGEVIKFFFDRDALFGERTSELAPQYLRHEQIAGTDTVVVRLTSNIGFPMDVYIDPSTGAYKRAIIDPNGKYDTTYDDLGYTESSGKRFLSSFRVDKDKAVYAYTKIEVNAPVTPEELHPPKQTATWTFGEGTAPVELTKDTYPRILIDLELNGVKGKFILDTGAGGTAITGSFARKIGAKALEATRIAGIGGSSAATVYQVDTIKVGPSVLHNVLVRSGLREDFEEGAVGLIGYDLLAGAIVDLDLDAGTVRVMDPAKVEPDQTKGLVIHADFSDQHIRVPMKLNGKVDVLATLDSGNPINVLFSQDLIYQQGLTFLVDPNDIGSTRFGGGVGSGYEVEHCGKLSSLELGPITYRPAPACDSTYESRNDILVGLDFMKNFNFVFDYPDGIMVMTPRK